MEYRDPPPRRHPAQAAIDRLAAMLGLPNTPVMQDWAWEVADAGRIDEFVALYGSPELSDDERFTLMETIIQSCEDLGDALDGDRRWAAVRTLLEKRLDLHLASVGYWAALDLPSADAWRVSPFMRDLMEKYRSRPIPSATL